MPDPNDPLDSIDPAVLGESPEAMDAWYNAKAMAKKVEEASTGLDKIRAENHAAGLEYGRHMVKTSLPLAQRPRPWYSPEPEPERNTYSTGDSELDAGLDDLVNRPPMTREERAAAMVAQLAGRRGR